MSWSLNNTLLNQGLFNKNNNWIRQYLLRNLVYVAFLVEYKTKIMLQLNYFNAPIIILCTHILSIMLRDRGQLMGKPLQSLREANLAKRAQKNWAWLPASICLSAIGQFIFYICQAIVTVVTWEHLGAYSCRTSFGSIQIPCFSLATKYFLVNQKRGIRVSFRNIYSRISYPWVSEDDYFLHLFTIFPRFWLD